MPKTTKNRLDWLESVVRTRRRSVSPKTMSAALLLDVAVSVVMETWPEPPTRRNAGAIQDAARDLVNSLM